MKAKTIVVLGGGVGGLMAVNTLRSKLSTEHKVVLVERDTQHAFAPSFLWLMTGARRVEEITTQVNHLVQPGIEVLHAEVLGIDPVNRLITTTVRSLNYDYLIVALGAELAPETIQGFTKDTPSFYTLKDTEQLQKTLHNFQGGTLSLVVSALPYKCPGAPHEAAMLLRNFFQKRSLSNPVDIHLYTPETQPMPVGGPELGKAVQDMLMTRQITFHPQHKLVSIDAQRRELNFEGKEPSRYDLVLMIPPHRCPKVVCEAGLAKEGGHGFLIKNQLDKVYS
ncbi:FAD/NAD(P)-binding oxidoreductase [Deltaproteobacteria bacterium TL4]